MELAVQVSTISGLSYREFVRLVFDNPDELIELKTLHPYFVTDDAALPKEQLSIFSVLQMKKIGTIIIRNSYRIIKQDVQDIAEAVMEKILNSLGIGHFVVSR